MTDRLILPMAKDKGKDLPGGRQFKRRKQENFEGTVSSGDDNSSADGLTESLQICASQSPPSISTPRQSSRLAAKSEQRAFAQTMGGDDDDVKAGGEVKRKRGAEMISASEQTTSMMSKVKAVKAAKEREAKKEAGVSGAKTSPKEDAKGHDKYCHFCQHAKKNMLACENPGCTHRYCVYCLSVHLGDDTDPCTSGAWVAGCWYCPTCRQGCCCSRLNCTRGHRHCKAFRYRCRRADAAVKRATAAHALVWLASGDETASAITGREQQVQVEHSKKSRSSASGASAAKNLTESAREVVLAIPPVSQDSMIMANLLTEFRNQSSEGEADGNEEASIPVQQEKEACDDLKSSGDGEIGRSDSKDKTGRRSSREGAALQALASLFVITAATSVACDSSEDVSAVNVEGAERRHSADMGVEGSAGAAVSKSHADSDVEARSSDGKLLDGIGMGTRMEERLEYSARMKGGDRLSQENGLSPGSSPGTRIGTAGTESDGGIGVYGENVQKPPGEGEQDKDQEWRLSKRKGVIPKCADTLGVAGCAGSREAECLHPVDLNMQVK